MKLAAIVAALAVAGTGTTARDPVGDAHGGPDITAVSVSHTAASVTFAVRFAHAPPLGVSRSGGWVDVLLVGIDVPPRGLVRTANGWRGLDYFVGLHGTDRLAMLVKASPGKPWQSRVVGRPKVTVRGSTLRISISRRSIGDPAWLELAAAAGREGATEMGGGDEAPNRGVIHHRLR